MNPYKTTSNPSTPGNGSSRYYRRTARRVLAIAVAIVGVDAFARRDIIIPSVMTHYRQMISHSGNASRTALPADPAEAFGRQIEQWECERQQAVESAQAARVAYAILRSRGVPESGASCQSQVEKAQSADRRAGQLGRQITHACRLLASHEAWIGQGSWTADELAGNTPTNLRIPEPMWHGGNDAFMLYSVSPEASR